MNTGRGGRHFFGVAGKWALVFLSWK
jgi:hypothetical protein